MAKAIVACPKCDKKFTVPEGSPPREFQCTECGTAVSYGETAPARPARARPAHGGGRGAARARPVAGGRSTGRARSAGRARGRYVDREGGELPPKDNTALYAVLGLVAVVVIAIVIVIVATSGDDPVTPVADGGGNDSNGSSTQPLDPSTAYDGRGGATPSEPAPGSGGTEPENPAPESTGPGSGIGGTNRPPPVRPSAGGTGNDGSEGPTARPPTEPVAENAPSGGFYGMDKSALYAKDYDELVVDLDHLTDTSSDLRQKIDQKSRLLVDYWAAREQLVAQAELIEVGRAAIPKILSAFRNVGDITTDEGIANTRMVDEAMRKIAGAKANRYPQITPMGDKDPKRIRKTIEEWYIWWYSKGYRMEEYRTDEPKDDE